jgi:Ca-activated chloride channel family protein
MTFLTPAWLWALLALPLLALVEIGLVRFDRERVARFVARPLWSKIVRRPAEGWRWVRLTLLLVGAAGFLVALARPQFGIVREKVEREGVDVVILLDSSGSMATEDVAPNRFFLARAALGSLVSSLPGDRFALVAFEGEAYPLVPLTLDADAVGLFLENLEPGVVPGPGTSLGLGIAKGLEMFVDKERRNKVMVLVSDGEDLEGMVDEAVRRAREAGVVVHCVAVGTDAGAPVPDFDREGRQVGFKKDESGAAVVSRLHAETLEAIAAGTGGRLFRIGSANTGLAQLTAAIDGIEQKSLAKEYSYRGKQWYQVPLGVGFLAIVLALLLPLPSFRRRKVPVAAAALLLALLAPLAGSASAQQPMPDPGSAAPAPVPVPMPGGAEPASSAPPPIQIVPKKGSAKLMDELMLAPSRATRRGRKAFEEGKHPEALDAFRQAVESRSQDLAARFNLADALYKNGRYDEAERIWREIAENKGSPLARKSLFNAGNSLYQRERYPDAIRAYRDALRAAPDDADTKKNLELALRALQKQQEQQKRQQQDQKDQNKDQKKDQQKQQQPQQRPQTEEEKEQKKFQQETGMSKEQAMRLLEALQRNEKDEQKKALAAKPSKKKGKDW